MYDDLTFDSEGRRLAIVGTDSDVISGTSPHCTTA